MGAAASVQQIDTNEPKQKAFQSKEKHHLKNSKTIHSNQSHYPGREKILSTSGKDKHLNGISVYKQQNINKSISYSTKLPSISKTKEKSYLKKYEKHLNKGFSFPLCLNNNQSTMVCLSPKCKSYPFYCLLCDKNCEQIHHHSAKVLSISYKQFYKKVINHHKRPQELITTAQNYRKCLTDLQKLITKYIDKQMKGLLQVERQTSMPVSIRTIKNNLQNYKYSGITGSSVSKLWKYYDHFEQKQSKMIKMIQSKQDSTQKLSECFANINKLSLNTNPQPSSQLISSSNKTFHPFRKYGHYHKVLDKQRAWTSNIQQ